MSDTRLPLRDERMNRDREKLRRAVEDGERLYRKSMHDPDGVLTVSDWNRIHGLLTLELADALALVDLCLARLERAEAAR